jgi:hypothetical protein
MPADDALREAVDDERDVDKPGPGAAVGKSATQRMLGAGAVKSRSSRSPARLPSLDETIVRARLPRLIPFMSSSRMSRSTEQNATRWPLRRT